jgi:hypothetical protein
MSRAAAQRALCRAVAGPAGARAGPAGAVWRWAVRVPQTPLEPREAAEVDALHDRATMDGFAADGPATPVGDWVRLQWTLQKFTARRPGFQLAAPLSLSPPDCRGRAALHHSEAEATRANNISVPNSCTEEGVHRSARLNVGLGLGDSLNYVLGL